MPKSDFQRHLQKGSISNRRRGFKADKTRIANLKELTANMSGYGADLSAYDNFQLSQYGGIVERTVIRRPFTGEEEAEISEDKAQWECSGFAVITGVAGTDSEFAEFEGRQIRYLLTLNDVFLYPSLRGAFAELLDEGVVIRTNKAEYRLGKRDVLNLKGAAARSMAKAA